MVNLKSFFLSLILLVPFITFSQDECGTDEIIRRNPFLQQQYTERVACAPEVDLDTAQVLTIPVVFHVIHLGEPVGEGTNISDEQILSCVENLNHRFRGDVEALAALTDEYDEYELSLVMDSKIEFCLAARDPNNEPTDGIMRYDGSNLSYTNTFGGQTSTAYYGPNGISSGTIYDLPLNDGIPDAVIKDWFHWPVDKYFNCYVVTEINNNNALNGIQGYSLVGSAGTGLTGYRYGPVCLYNVTGTVGELKPSRTLNATWTHEIGHALDLFHTFGFSGNNGCDPETNPCSQGDQVPDTPPTSTNESCGPSPCPDAIIQNYMDYTPETCRIMFTQGQIERMRDEVWTGLPYLVSDNNVSCQSPNAIDLAISSVTLPNTWCEPTIDFNVKISNFGGNDISGAELIFDGASYPLPTISAGSFELVSFTDYPLGNGIFTFEVVYDEDQYLDNNTLTHVVEQLEENVVEVILSPDVWANEINWKITDENENIVLYGGNYPLGSDDIDFYESTCLPDGCYIFTITDTNGDGMCSFDFENDGICDIYYDSFVNVITNGEVILDISEPENIDYGSELIFEFCIEYSCPLENDLCPWDLNDDNRVNSNDLLVMLSIINQEVGPCTPGDFNFDGVINQDDLNILLDNYGTICTEGLIENKDLTVGKIGTNGIDSYMVFDLLGNRINDESRLAPGIYIIVEYYSNGDIISKKIYLQGNEQY